MAGGRKPRRAALNSAYGNRTYRAYRDDEYEVDRSLGKRRRTLGTAEESEGYETEAGRPSDAIKQVGRGTARAFQKDVGSMYKQLKDQGGKSMGHIADPE